MAVAPEPYLSACMTVLYQSAVWCRVWGWNQHVDPEHLAELMDAIHNIPGLVRHWERCDIDLLRAMLGDYERKWINRGGLALLRIFDAAVAEPTTLQNR